LGDHAIVLDEISGAADLPIGWGDEQEAGTYRLKRHTGAKAAAFFAYNLGPDSWKKFISPQRRLLWQARKQNAQLALEVSAAPATKYAFVGVRNCELAAVKIQERVREVSGLAPADACDEPFLVGVTCAQAAATCFCQAMGTGPGLGTGYDLGLTEFVEGHDHYFVVEIMSERGREIASDLQLSPCDANDGEAVRQQAGKTAQAMTRGLELDDPAQFFRDRLEHGRWDDVASRCLSCANCTLVCPTCFCTTVEDTSDLSGDNAQRWLRWDSCFNLDFTFLHGGSVRQTTRSRYRQWLTHKLGTWHEQFGSSGCVGCGRCIAWCPVGIDLTVEVEALKQPASARKIE
jgi:formate hydrogenlyase subunit 6/NADH:ubiquinone oxidoreductase subunit I